MASNEQRLDELVGSIVRRDLPTDRRFWDSVHETVVTDLFSGKDVRRQFKVRRSAAGEHGVGEAAFVVGLHAVELAIALYQIFKSSQKDRRSRDRFLQLPMLQIHLENELRKTLPEELAKSIAANHAKEVLDTLVTPDASVL